MAALIGVAALRGADFHVTRVGHRLVRRRAAVLFAVFMYGIAETLASRMPQQEEYIARDARGRDRAVVPRGRAVPDRARCPAALTGVRQGPPAHPRAGADALRPASTDSGTGLHDIWGMGNTTVEASLSLAVVLAFAAALTLRGDPGVLAVGRALILPVWSRSTRYASSR